MKKEKVIYNGESRVVRTDEKDNKYILYNTKKVYLEKKGGVGSALPPQTSFRLPSSSYRVSSSRAGIASVASALARSASKTAKEVLRSAKHLPADLAAATSATAETMISPVKVAIEKEWKLRNAK